jgi:hypothetical protein
MVSIKKIFDHVISSSYVSQSTWEVYTLFVFEQNASEGICDALLAVSEANRQFAYETPMREPELVELSNHISQRVLKFVVDDETPSLLRKRDPHMNLRSDYSSRGLKRSLEEIILRFRVGLTWSFSNSATGWNLTPGQSYEVFKEFAVCFENALGDEYDKHYRDLAASTTTDVDNISTSFGALSIASTESPASGRSAANKAKQPPLTKNCFRCRQYGHWIRECPNPPVKATTPTTSPSSPRCYNCGKVGHYSHACLSLRKRSKTPTRTRAGDKCFNCNEMGHWSRDCPHRRQGGLASSRSRY